MPWNVGLPQAEWYKLGDRRLESIIREVLDLDEVALDTETTGLNVIDDVPLYWSLAWGAMDGGRRICMPATTIQLFRESFADRTKRWVFAGAKFDRHMLANVGIDVAGELMCIQVMHSLLYEEESHDLKHMEKQLLGWQTRSFKDLFEPKPGEGIGDRLIRAEQEVDYFHNLIEYASSDAYCTWQIYLKLREELERETTWSLYPELYPTFWHLFFKIEMPFTKVLWKCERRGVKVDTGYLKGLQGPIEEEIKKIERKINQLAGRIINPRSTPQLRDWFFNKLKVKPRTYTKGGQKGVREPSMDAGMLEWIAEQSDNADAKQAGELLLRYRDLCTTNGTYIVGMQKRLDHRSRVHTRFNQDVARTGRLSSADPNMQNVKTVEEDEWRVRGAFISDEGHNLIVGDYEQLEMRLLAAASGEQSMIDIFLSGRDIHMGNAITIFGPSYQRKHNWTMTYEDIVEAKKIDKKVKAGELGEEAMTEHVKLALVARLRSKTIGFGMNYGMKENKLSRSLDCTKQEAKDLIALYLEGLPAVDKFFETARDLTNLKGASFTLLGRRRIHIDICSMNPMDRWAAERQAVNNHIQGTAADVVKLAMIHCDRAGLDTKYGCHMQLQVHDELMFECPKETTKEAQPVIQQIMEHPLPSELSVPLTVSIGSGPSWINAK
jgi:DNA polymerase I